MEFVDFVEREIYLDCAEEVSQAENFLKNHGIQLDQGLEVMWGIYAGSQIIAVGAIHGKTLRCIAVDTNYQGTGVLNRLLSRLIQLQYQRGNTHLFIYTKPEHVKSFTYLGFYKVAEVPSRVALLENHPEGVQRYLAELAKTRQDGQVIAGAVVNCNPFTLGHQYLLEKAAAISDVLHVFVVWEERSVFPAEVRYRLVQEGTRHLNNVILHQGRDYVISNATFPSYFLKDDKEVVQTHALLDLTIFAEYIAPTLGINLRIVGEEPYCPVTNTYNTVMREYLPDKGVRVIEIKRQTVQQEVISASKVRELIRNGQLTKVQELVPPTTYDFLTSPEAEQIIQNIQQRIQRH